jgi:hypothetical protein
MSPWPPFGGQVGRPQRVVPTGASLPGSGLAENSDFGNYPVMGHLSPHLFWDVRAEEVDPERHAAWLARRVLEYGDWPDWQELVRYYGRERLAEVVTGVRSLQPRALAFCSVWFDLPVSTFRCSATPPSR